MAKTKGKLVRATCQFPPEHPGDGPHTFEYVKVTKPQVYCEPHRKGWVDNLREVRRRCLCILCLHRRGEKVRNPELELVDEAPTDAGLPMPSELDWKREVRRRR